MNPYRTPGIVEKYEDESNEHPGSLPCPANKAALPILRLEVARWSLPHTNSWVAKLLHANMLEFDNKSQQVAICFKDFSWVFKSTWHMDRELNSLYARLQEK